MHEQKGSPKKHNFLLLGPSGSGKTTLGHALAEHLGYVFIEGDDHHPASNIEKMRTGLPLTDEDRAPWLASIGRAIAAQKEKGRPAVISCSALKASYRELLKTFDSDLIFICLSASKTTLERRLQEREHFMPSSLVADQLQIFEPPNDGIAVNNEQAIEKVLQEIFNKLATQEEGRP